MAAAVTQSAKEQFARDGALKLPGLLNPEQLARLRVCFDWGVAHNEAPTFGLEGELPGDGAGEDEERHTLETFGFPADMYNDNANPAAQPMYAEVLPTMPFADALAELWGSEHVWFISEELFAKTDGQAGRSPWHQDSSYMPFAGQCVASVWISFENLPQKNSLEMIRGTHLGPRYDGARYDDPDQPRAPLWGADFGPPLPDIDAERANDPNKWTVVSWPVTPGDAIVFHMNTFPGGAPVTPDCPERHTLALRFFGDDATIAPVPESLWPTGDRQPGDPAAGPEYIQLR